ncbi:MAG: RHS repeat-associated core domain-containing protein [Cryomorphaceae bacterium]|jgi:RHS repeat-associated protein|nr:RHS repeat-associated core domain-containing protein [Cryomorphaceae bacterium]MBT6995756.1 RHS repeat-associated core domain-containing protein [Candidatus Woesearchaeota archaeon]
MKSMVIFVVLLILFSNIAFAKDVVIPETFEDVGDGETTYFYAGSKLVASKNDDEVTYHYQNRLGSDVDSKSLPFGQLLKEGERFSFTGKELDSDLYYFNARYYDSNLGRFTSVDPVPSEPAYQYVGNNPVNMVDPSGMAFVPSSDSQISYFGNLESYYKEGGIPNSQIDEMRGMVESGTMKFYPEDNEWNDEPGVNLPFPSSHYGGTIIFSNFIYDWLGSKNSNQKIHIWGTRNANLDESDWGVHIAVLAENSNDLSIAAGAYELYRIYKSTQSNVRNEGPNSAYINYRSYASAGILLKDHFVGAAAAGAFLKNLDRRITGLNIFTEARHDAASKGDFFNFFKYSYDRFHWADSREYSSYKDELHKYSFGQKIKRGALKFLRLEAYNTQQLGFRIK